MSEAEKQLRGDPQKKLRKIKNQPEFIVYETQVNPGWFYQLKPVWKLLFLPGIEPFVLAAGMQLIVRIIIGSYQLSVITC